MKKFIVFFSIVLSIYAAVNLYLFIRGWQAIPPDSGLRIFYAIGFLIVASAFIAGRILERLALSRFSEILTWMGSFWLACMLYLCLFGLAADILIFINTTARFLPETAWLTSSHITISIAALTFLTVAGGHINARHFRVRKMTLDVQKRAGGIKDLNIVIASDIHLGTIIGRKRLDHIVDTINGLDPDIVLLPGDVVDEDLAPVIKENLGESLRRIQTKLGVFSITGNHEFIGGADAASQYLADHGISVLRDEVVKIADSFFLAGREDRSVTGFAGKRRKTMNELLGGIDPSYPILLMDHQPFHLEEAAKNNVDLQLSGHTHHGQMWPFNYITKKVFEVSWGYIRKGNTHIYVSCGVGTWGPPVRTGNRPEIVQMRLKFKN